MNMKKILSLFLLITILTGILTGCAAESGKAFDSPEDFEQAKIGVMNGSIFHQLANIYYPEATLFYMNIPDLILNMKQNKIDGVLMDKAFFAPLVWEDYSLTYMDMDMPATEYAVAFPKSEKSKPLVAQFNEFIRTQTENGWLAEQEAKWFSLTAPSSTVDMSQLTGENGTLRVAANVEIKPFGFMLNGQLCGYDAELLYRFAEEYGYALDVDLIDFGAILPGLAADRYDLAIAGFTVTEERKESVTFSDPYYKSPIIMTVLRDGASADGGQGSQQTLADFENAKIGVMTGTVYDDYAKNKFPNAKREYYNLISDMIVGVEQGKLDGYLSESTYVTAAIWEGARIQSIDETIDQTHAGFIFPKNEQSKHLLEQMNAFIRASKENGTMDRLSEKWFGETEPKGDLDFDSLTGENGTIRVAVTPDLKPITYLQNGKLTGYEAELIFLFAQEYGYKLDIDLMAFDAILPGVTSGRYDIGTGAITITEERAQSLDYSESHLTVDVVMVVKAGENVGEIVNFWEELKEDFHKTFIRENRWELIVEGVGVTMLITVCSAIAGTLLGFGLYMLSRSDSKAIRTATKGFAKGYSRIIEGTPIVVILMILFYVVFGKMRNISGILVSILCFALTFGAFVYDHMTVSVGSVDRGQTEAAYALGYTKNKTFFRIVLPQAMDIFLPSYCGQAMELIKATAVVGYVAVNDLTKMGDIIRSNTYEAFFPLIATAVIYFMLTWGMALLLGLVKRHYQPKRRSKEAVLKHIVTE